MAPTLLHSFVPEQRVVIDEPRWVWVLRLKLQKIIGDGVVVVAKEVVAKKWSAYVQRFFGIVYYFILF